MPASFIAFYAYRPLCSVILVQLGAFLHFRLLLMFCILAVCVHCICVMPLSDVKKHSPYSIIERRVPELIPVLGSQPAVDVSYKPGGRLPLLSARPAVTPATLKRAAASFAAW